MKEIIKFLKQKQNIRYSLWMIIFGLIFALSFQANKAQISQILEKPIRIVPGSEEAKQYQVSGWQGVWSKGKKSILKVSLPRKRTYQMTVKAFSCSPPDVRDQRIEVYFNNIALDRLKFRKTSRWQEFSINIHPYLIKEVNTIKLIYTQDTQLYPVIFSYIEFRNYTTNIKGLYLLFDSPVKKRINYLTHQVLSYFFGFAILLLVFWLFYSRFLFRLIGGPAGEASLKIKFSRAARIDFWTYFPSIILLSLLALISYFSSYHFVYSLKTFFVLGLAPTAVLKLFSYRNLPLRFLKIIFRFISRNIEKISLGIKKTCSILLVIPSFLKTQVSAFKKFFIYCHRKNFSSAFILDFILFLVLSAFFLLIGVPPIAEGLAVIAYLLLVIGVVMKVVAFFRESRRGK